MKKMTLFVVVITQVSIIYGALTLNKKTSDKKKLDMV